MIISKDTLKFLALNDVLKTYNRWSKTRNNINIIFKKDTIILISKGFKLKTLTKKFNI